MTDADGYIAALGATPVPWMTLVAAAVPLWVGVRLSAGGVPSDRPSISEQRVDLTALSPASMQRLRSARIPGREGAWNALVIAHDDDRIRAHVRANRLARWLGFWSFVVGGLLVAASLCSIVALYVDVARTGVLSFSGAVRFTGLFFVLVFGGIAVPGLTLSLAQSAQRARMPFEWRLLARCHVIKALSSSPEDRWFGSEAPKDGRVTLATARSLLRTLEAESINSFPKPRKSSASDLLVWRTYDAPRLSLVLEAKAHLLRHNRAHVRAEEIYDWIDLLVDELVNRRTVGRALASTPIMAELFEPSVYAHAKRVLWMAWWQSPARLLAIALALALAVVCVLTVHSGFRSVFGEYEDELSLMGPVLLAAAGVILSCIAEVFARRFVK